jgi:uncharacterized protein (DUF2384 family)
MASQKKNVLVHSAKGNVKARPKGVIRKSLRTVTRTQRETSLPKQVTAKTVRAHALEAFGNVEKTDHWLRRPNQLFQGLSPLQVLELDPAAVEAEIVRIEHGVYV